MAADVRPFRGVTFDPARVDVGRALCPPYDVISPRQQAAYYDRDPHNAVRIVLNRAEGDGRYLEAGRELDDWLADGTLRRAATPSFYVHRHRFAGPSGPAERVGLLAAVRLEPWATGAVRPHEHTMPGPKEDRLKLMRATAADTEPIWVFEPDPRGDLRGRLAKVVRAEPLLRAEFVPEASSEEVPSVETHELWEVADPGAVADLAALTGASQLYIADGHHRYETALFHAGEVGGGPEDASRFKLMLLTASEDPGLLVLPTHRLVRLPHGRGLGAMMAALETAGWITEQPATLEALLARLDQPAAAGNTGFGILADRRYSYLEGPASTLATGALPPSIAALDVSVVHEWILRPLLGIGPDELAAGELVVYTRDPLEARAKVVAGEYDIALFLRAPTLAQVQAVADAGENMPQKSTYFWPKPASGLILALQRPGDAL